MHAGILYANNTKKSTMLCFHLFRESDLQITFLLHSWLKFMLLFSNLVLKIKPHIFHSQNTGQGILIELQVTSKNSNKSEQIKKRPKI